MNQRVDTDVFMLTYNRPHYTAMSLPALLENCDPATRVWVWHNGDDEETLEVVRKYQSGIYRFYHSRENLKLRAPTNWFFEHSKGAYLGKVDDDCIVPKGWTQILREAHQVDASLGVIACWHFQKDDFDPVLASKKIRPIDGSRQLLENFWVQGSGYLMKRACVDQQGPLKEGMSFTQYCIELGRKGWVNGWHVPLLYEDHMDDPRSPRTAIRSNEDLSRNLPLSASKFGINSLDAWAEKLKRSAVTVQTAPIDPGYWSPLRRKMRRLKGRAQSLLW